MPLLTTGYKKKSIAECVAFCPNFGKSASPLSYNGPIYFHRLPNIYSLRVWELVVCRWVNQPSVINIAVVRLGPRPRQLNKTPPPQLPAVTLGERRRRDGR